MNNILSCFGNKSKSEGGNDNTQEKWENMTPEQKKERIQQLWSKARRYNNKLRFQARLQKMAESNLKEMMIDDINEDADEENEARSVPTDPLGIIFFLWCVVLCGFLCGVMWFVYVISTCLVRFFGLHCCALMRWSVVLVVFYVFLMSHIGGFNYCWDLVHCVLCFV